MIQYYKEPLGWVVENDSFDSQTLAKCEAVFAQSNGYMGIHSASMGGLWQCAALGFAGLRQEEDKLYLAPQLPKEWSRLAFRFVWRGCPVMLEATHEMLKLHNIGDKAVQLHFGNEVITIAPGEEIQHVLKEI